VEAKKAVELVEADLALLNDTSAGWKKNCKKKALVKAKEATKEALGMTQETKTETKEAEEVTKVTYDMMKAGFQADLEKAMKAVEDAKGTMAAAANQMFAFYLNLLSPKSKYSWNRTVSKQTESDPFVNLQSVSLEGPRRMSCKLFNDCIMFHLLTAFPINAAEQEKYYITNVLKKHQHVNVHQCVHHVKQLNAYITQMPCFYYSPNANASTKPENVLLMEAELGSHVLRMCPIQWQDLYNMNEKGMTSMDMRLLLTLLEAIKRVCTYEKGKLESSEKSSNKGKKGKKHPGTDSTARVPKKVRFEKHCNLCKKHGGTFTMHNTCDCHRFEKDRKEKSDFRTAKKGGKKGNHMNQSFAQLTEKIMKLEKALKQSGKKVRKCRYKDGDSDSE
jgi:hypothetical protein